MDKSIQNKALDAMIKHKRTIVGGIHEPLTSDVKQELILSQNDAERKNYNRVHDALEEQIKKRKAVPTPKIHLLKSEILVKAVPPLAPKRNPTGIILNDVSGTVTEMERLKNSTESVSDFQEVVLVGNHLLSQENNIIQPGDFVKINFKQYHGIAPGSQDGQVRTQYNIPMFRIDGHDYIMLDFYDIMYVQKREDVNPDHL